MDKLKDIFNNFKDRFTNPLVFSFICSWIVINWKVTVALLWSDSKEIEDAGFKTIFDFISANTNPNKSVFYPLIFALAYTFLMPFIKNLIRALYTWTSKWGENWNLSILKGGKIAIDKYFRFREDYDKRTQLLVDIISKENEIVSNYDSLKTNLLESQANENVLRQQLAESKTLISRSTDVQMLNGDWKNTFSDTVKLSFTGAENVRIENGSYHTIEFSGQKKHHFNIIFFHFNIESKRIFFIKERIGQQESYVPHGSSPKGPNAILRYNPNDLILENQNLLVGFENGTTRIEYRRM